MRALLFLILSCLCVSAQLSIRSPFYVAQVIKPSSGGTAPAAPSGLQVTAVDATGVTLGWADESTDETGFWVEVYNGPSGAVWEPVNGDMTDSDPNPTAANDVNYFASVNQTTPLGVQAELSYCKFRVFATNNFGASSYSAEVQVPPSVAVSDLDAVWDGMTGIEVSWTATGENYTKVQVYSNINGAGYTLNGEFNSPDADDGNIPLADTTDEAAALALMQTVLFRIRYVNSGGDGPYSNAVAAHE